MGSICTKSADGTAHHRAGASKEEARDVQPDTLLLEPGDRVEVKPLQKNEKARLANESVLEETQRGVVTLRAEPGEYCVILDNGVHLPSVYWQRLTLVGKDSWKTADNQETDRPDGATTKPLPAVGAAALRENTSSAKMVGGIRVGITAMLQTQFGRYSGVVVFANPDGTFGFQSNFGDYFSSVEEAKLEPFQL